MNSTNTLWGIISAVAFITHGILASNPNWLPGDLKWVETVLVGIAGGGVAKGFQRSVDYKDAQPGSLKSKKTDIVE